MALITVVLHKQGGVFTKHILRARHGDKLFTCTLEFHITLSPYHA